MYGCCHSRTGSPRPRLETQEPAESQSASRGVRTYPYNATPPLTTGAQRADRPWLLLLGISYGLSDAGYNLVEGRGIAPRARACTCAIPCRVPGSAEVGRALPVPDEVDLPAVRMKSQDGAAKHPIGLGRSDPGHDPSKDEACADGADQQVQVGGIVRLFFAEALFDQ